MWYTDWRQAGAGWTQANMEETGRERLPWVDAHDSWPSRKEHLEIGANNNRNGPEHTGMDQNAPEWASITGMDININLFYASKFIILP